jgi:large subunit ribosomal protein L29
MKPEEIRSMTTDEIERKLEEKREELFNLRFQLAMHQLKDHNCITKTKREIARLLTILREREEEWEGGGG